MTNAPAFDNSVRIGYARVSTRAQDHQAQLDALARRTPPRDRRGDRQLPGRPAAAAPRPGHRVAALAD